MILKKSSFCLILSAAITSSNIALAADTQQAEKGLFFFEEVLPKNITSNQDNIEISSHHYRDGKSALHWTFQPQEQLIFNAPVDLKEDDNITPKTFLAWIYNEKPAAEKLHFAFGKDNEVKTQFDASLNFSGWRGIAVPFRDMEGKAEEGINRLTITAPNQAGELYLDQVMLSVPVDNRWPIPDYTTPFVNKAVNTMVSKNWSALLMYDDMFKKHYPELDFKTKLDDQAGSSAQLYQKAEQHLGLNNNPVSVEKLEENLKAYQKFGITDEDGVINGPPMEFPARQKYMKAKGVFDAETKAHLLGKTNDLRTIGKTLLQTAKYLRNPTIDQTLREKLTAQFLLTTRYVIDQGFVRGSGYQIITHVGYQTRELFDAWFLERHLLEKNQLLAPTQQAMLWFNATGRIFEPDEKIVDADVDILNTQLQWMVKSILMLPNQEQREALLTQLSSWLTKTINRSKGVAGGLKSDGSIFHHSQHYVAYARDAFGGLAPTIYILSGSPYNIDKAAHERLVDGLYKMWVYSKDANIPIVLSGRHPTGKFDVSSEPFKWLALAGEVENAGQINKKLAAVYARLNNQTDFEGVQPAAEPSGAWAMNMAGMAIQRRPSTQDKNKSWLAVARGFSRYLVGNESYESNNRYGRYGQYGTLEIIPADFSQRAFSHSGWDWNRYSGITSIHLPWEELKSNLIQLPAAGIEEMLLSTETYLGANTLNDNAMFAVKLHGHSKYEQEGFTARKSYFMFDNRIIALGSGINSTDEKHNVETTLFQHAVPTLTPITVNGGNISTLQTQKEIQGEAVTLKDPANNYYFVPKGYDVDVYYQHQTSLDDRNDKPTENNFATAIINHGKAPKNAGYEYSIVVDGGEKADKPDYKVLHHDNQLHAVRDSLTGQEDYAYFEQFTQDVGGVVFGSDAPTLVMAAEKNDQLSLSVVNPDLAFYEGVEKDQVDENGKQVEVSIYSREWREADSKPQTSHIILKNVWQLVGESSCASTQTKEDKTVVTVTTTAATPCKIELKK